MDLPDFVNTLRRAAFFVYFVYSILGTLGSEHLEEDTDVSDRSFPSFQVIHGRNITCGSIQRGLKFPTQTWTCSDARVNGIRLAYGLYPGIGVDERCLETRGIDELSEICITMMRMMDVNKPLWAAMVTKASCMWHEEDRAYLVKNVKGGYKWTDIGSGFGMIDTFRCMGDR